jgi:hypothetical protein
MREPRNPFRLRRAESIDTETAFLSLFEPGILDVIPADTWSESVHIFRSAAGGGKTSLIRLFTPGVLLALHARRAEDGLKELYQRLEELGAIDESGPRVLGVTLLCGPGYSMLNDLDLDQGRKDRLLFGLLNARIVLAALRSALALRQLDFPRDLDRLTVAAVDSAGRLPGLSFPCSGRAAYDWAEQREASICESLDSFGPLRAERLPGDDNLAALSLMRADSLKIDGEPVAARTVLMMDDIHKLTTHQRSLLIQTVIETRSPVGVWIAERFEALSTPEMLGSGAHEGRDYEKPVELERYWRGKSARFEKLTLKIADRRVRAAAETEVGSFRACVHESLDSTEWEPTFEKALAEVSARVHMLASADTRFRDWVAAREEEEGTLRERARSWRTLEILIQRELNRPQKSLFHSLVPLDEEELKQKDDLAVQQAAELFLAREYELPYYFGTERISRLASLNIQQFLGLAGEIFEEAAAAELLRRPTSLSPMRQHCLIKAAAKAVWDEIPRRVRHGREVRNFLDSVGRFARWYTYRPTAPNDRGVGGTAIRMSERALLLDEANLRTRPDHRRFADLLASALAHNLLVADLDYSCKNVKEKWMVLNLNRLLCVQFDLPLGYGLYKERPLQTLCQWMGEVFSPPSTQEALV